MQSFKKHLAEKLKASDDMGTWVKDFQDSDAPQFKGKSKEKKRQMAIAAKLDAEREAGMREEVELDEAKRKGAPKMQGDWLKKEREKNREHDAAMGRTPTGRKKPVRQMTSTQRSLAQLRGESVELEEKYTATSEKSKFGKGGYRPHLKNPEGKTSYMASVSYKTHDHAAGEAAAYHKGYTSGPGKANERGAERAVAAYRAKHKQHMHEEVEQLDELSPNTLHRYIKKASGNLAGNSAANAAIAASQVDKPKAQKANRKDLVRNIHNRMKGITSASGRLADKANQNESLDTQSQFDLVESYLLENNIDPDSLSIEQLDEIIGKVLGTAFKVGARTAVGAAKLAKKAVVNKQGNIRGTQAARQDAAGDRAEKEARKKEAEYKRKKRIQDMKKRASDLDQKISDLSNNK